MTRRWLPVLVLLGLGACADPCVDDGLLQDPGDVDACPGAAAGTEGDTDSASQSASDTDSASNTASTSNSASNSASTTATDTDSASATDTDSVSATDSATDTDSATATTDSSDSGGSDPLWCEDADGDGFGDAAACVMVPEDEEPPDGTVDNDDDCDDTSADTFPGAAPNDDPIACMKDTDGDDWGDDTPPGAVQAGSDCDEDGAPPCALVVTQDGTNDDDYDQGLSGVLDDLGYVITYVADTDAVLADANGFTLVVVSETAQSVDIAGTFGDAIVPAICLEGLVWDDMGMAPEGIASNADDVDILAPADPLAGGLVGTVDVMGGPGSGTFFTAPPAGATAIASTPGDVDQVVEFAFDEGAAMLGGFIAPRRRVGLGYDADQGNGPATIQDDGLILFEAAVVWVTG